MKRCNKKPKKKNCLRKTTQAYTKEVEIIDRHSWKTVNCTSGGERKEKDEIETIQQRLKKTKE